MTQSRKAGLWPAITGLLVACLSFPATASFIESFDSYATGASLHGVGGWKGWSNDPSFAAPTTSAQAFSVPNSVDISGNADLVHEFSGYNFGTWVVSARQYISTNSVGTSYFILLNSYVDSLVGLNWSTQVQFNSSTGQILNDGIAGGFAAIVYDSWVDIRNVIDLDADTQSFYYNGNLLFSSSWTEGLTGSGALNIGAIDLFANAATSVYYDDISILNADIPLPATLALLSLGLAGIAYQRRKLIEAA